MADNRTAYNISLGTHKSYTYFIASYLVFQTDKIDHFSDILIFDFIFFYIFLSI